jgi:hypothetical protein
MQPSTYEAHKGLVITQWRVLGYCLGHGSRSWCASYGESVGGRWQSAGYTEEQATKETRRCGS